MRRKLPWPLVAAIATLAVVALVQAAGAFPTLAAALHPSGGLMSEIRESMSDMQIGVFIAFLPALITVALIVGLALRWRWARWLTIARCILGIAFNIKDGVKLLDLTGGLSSMDGGNLIGFLSIVFTASACITVTVLLFLPSAAEAFEKEIKLQD
jgi:hypothetical protein